MLARPWALSPSRCDHSFCRFLATKYSASLTGRLQQLDGERSRTCQHLPSFNCENRLSGMARVRLADLNGPKWTSSGQNGPKCTILVHFGLANAEIPFRKKVILTKMVKIAILDHFGPAQLPAVPRPLLSLLANRLLDTAWKEPRRGCSYTLERDRGGCSVCAINDIFVEDWFVRRP